MAGYGDRPDDLPPASANSSQDAPRLPSAGWSTIPDIADDQVPRPPAGDGDEDAFDRLGTLAGDGDPEFDADLDDADIDAFLDAPIGSSEDASVFGDADGESALFVDAPSHLGHVNELPHDGTIQVGVVRERYLDEQEAAAFEAAMASASSERVTTEEAPAFVDDPALLLAPPAEGLRHEVPTDAVEIVPPEDTESAAETGPEYEPAEEPSQASEPDEGSTRTLGKEPEHAYTATTVESVDEDVLRETSASWEAVAQQPGRVGDAPMESDARRRRETPFGMEAAPPNITPLELDGGLPEGEFHWLNQFDLFRAEVQRLARAKRWRRVAAVTAHAVMHAPYSTGGTRVAMLLDLARIYRDRLKDSDRAQEAFAAVAAIESENAEALAYLVDAFEASGDDLALYDLYYAAVESTWDPQDRLTWTKACASIATDRLNDPALATRAWEQLWRLGDAEETSSRELARAYRATHDWTALASFLQQRAEQVEGATRDLVMRELAEVLRFGTDDGAAAAEVLEQLRRRRPNDPVVVQQLCELYADLQRWERLVALAPAESRDRTRLRVVADTLWSAGRREQAAGVSQQVLLLDPTDAVARERIERWLRESEQYDALVNALEQRIASTRDEDEKIALLSEAAEITERHLGEIDRAVQMIDARIAIEGATDTTLAVLAGLLRQTTDHARLATVLRQRLEDTTDVSERASLLREVAACESAMGRTDGAEQAWSALLDLMPSDAEAFGALARIRRERGDHESLVTTLEQQIQRTAEREDAVRLRRSLAEYLDAHFSEPARAAEAWERVLNDAPDDEEALAALARHAAAADDAPARIRALEQQIRISDSAEQRTAWTLEIASLRESAGEYDRAAAAYERVLHWEPEHLGALNGLVRVFSAAGRNDLAVRALDAAVVAAAVDTRASLLRRSLTLLDEDAHVERVERLRRVGALVGLDEVVDELEQAAEAAGAWTAFESVLAHCSDLASGAEQGGWVNRRCALLELQMNRADRAFACRVASLWHAEAPAEHLDEALRLATLTENTEAWIALRERQAMLAPEQRVAMLTEVATALTDAGDDPERALEAWRRVLAHATDTAQALEAIEAIAATHDLADALASIHATEAIGADGTGVFRAVTVDDALREALIEASEAADDWQWTLPMLEAWSTARLVDGDVDALAQVAKIAHEVLEDDAHAFELYALVLEADPAQVEAADALEGMATTADRQALLASSLRRAASRTEDAAQEQALLERTAALLTGLGNTSEALDVHRRILALNPHAERALETVIDDLREHGRAAELRERLLQSLELSLGADERRSRMLECARLSESPLGDVATALHMYTRVLEANPSDAEAKRRMESLVAEMDDPALRARFLEMEVDAAQGAARAQLQRQLAELQLERMQDLEGGLATLSASVAEFGPEATGLPLLVDLLRRHRQWSALADLLVGQAGTTSDPERRLALVRDALDASLRAGDASPEKLADLQSKILELAPDDRPARRWMAQYYRSTGDDTALFDALGALADASRSDDERDELLRERARLLHHNLADESGAKEAWTALLETGRSTAMAHAALATLARQAEAIAPYVAHRRGEAATREPAHAALILCHLAEACDEAGEMQDELVELYREARRLHPACAPAMEALKGIGRRRRDLRPDAALWNHPDERSMTWASRAEALTRAATALEVPDPDAAIDLHLRAVATDPDRVGGWDALADAYASIGKHASAYHARLEALEALRRSTAVRPETVDEEAERLLALAKASRADAGDEAFDRLVRRVHELAPTHAPTALVVAQRELDQGDAEDAFGLLDGLMSRHAAKIPFDLQASVLRVRASARRALGDVPGARSDLQAALIHDPLDGEALRLLAAMEFEAGRFVEAVPHQVRALAVAADGALRARRFFELGEMWEDGLGEPDEAGACFVAARVEGLDSRALLHRMLRHHARAGQLASGLEIVDTLLESARDPEELAQLWVSRGRIFAQDAERDDEAIEAFDMALSYDPDCDDARLALADVLERRRDWEGTLQILEGIADGTEGRERAESLVRAARIARVELGDLERAERWLSEAVAALPSREGVQEWAALVGARSPGSERHLELLAQQTLYGPPWYDTAMEIGEHVLGTDPSWGWCLLAPALVIRDSDDDLKARLREMRRDFERPPIRLAPEGAWPLPAPLQPLRDVLVALESKVSLGRKTVADIDASASEVSIHSNVGRTFAQLADHYGHEVCSLSRVDVMDEAVCLARSAGRIDVVVRSDVFQQMARAEIGFVLSYAVALCDAGARPMAALPAEQRPALIEALFEVCGFADATGVRAQQLAETILAATSEEDRVAWADALDALSDESAAELGRRYWSAVRERALAVGLLAGADLHQAVRLLARMESDDAKPSVFDDGDAYDAYLRQSAARTHLVVTASTPVFGALLRDAAELA